MGNHRKSNGETQRCCCLKCLNPSLPLSQEFASSADGMEQMANMANESANMANESANMANENPNAWRAVIYDIMTHFADSQGMPGRCCVLDHDDHIHLIYRCNCPKNCEPQNINVNVTLEMLKEVYPEDRMHIHEKKTGTRRTKQAVIDGLPLREFDNGMSETGTSCAICCGQFGHGDTVATLPCGHAYRRDCVVPWLQRACTCPECRAVLPHEHE